jgi:hypothetical protein
MATQAITIPRTAAPGKSNWLLRIFPSFSDLAFIMPLVVLFSIMHGTEALLGDGDPGWHIRTGQWILQNHRVPQTDIFSFTHFGQPWFAWEWLWDVTFGFIHQTLGMGVVLIISMTIIAITMSLVFRHASKLSGNPVLAIGLTLLACASASIHFLARPHLFTLLLTAIFMILLESRKSRGQFIYWIFPVLELFWVNLHGGFIAGIVLTAGYAAGAVILALSRGNRLAAAIHNNRGMLITAALCFAVTFLNPYTYHLHQHVFQFLADPYSYTHIAEFQPLSFSHPAAKFFEPLALLGAVAAAWSLVRKRFDHALLVALLLHQGLMSARNVPIFAIVATPIIARCMRDWLFVISRRNAANFVGKLAGWFRSFGHEVTPFERVPRLRLTSVAAIALVASVLYAPNPPESFLPAFHASAFPVKAAEHLGAPGNRVLSIDTWGGYLIYSQYPSRKVFVDGRSDFFGDAFENTCFDLFNARPGWRKLLDSYHFDRLMLPPDIALVSTLRLTNDWKAVYEDKTAVVFEPVSSSGKASELSSAAPSAQKNDVATTSAVAEEVVTIPNHKEKRGV